MSVSESSHVDWRPDAAAIASQLQPLLQQLESHRLQARSRQSKATTACLLIVIGGLIVSAVMAMVSGPDGVVAGLMVFVISAIIAGIAYSGIRGNALAEYRSRYKSLAFAQAAKIAAPGIRYAPDQMVSKSTFQRSGLYRSRIDRFRGEDCFQGKVGATDILLSELHVERKEETRDSEGRTSTRWVTVFKGIYLVADFHKHFKGWVMIEPDFAEAAFGWLGRKLQSFSGKLLRLENPEFERAFKVTASDEVEARYLLTPEMQERFLNLRRRWPAGIAATLVDSNLHLAIPKQDNWFEPDLDRPAFDSGQLSHFLQQMVVTLHIVEQLDLNTRLWTK